MRTRFSRDSKGLAAAIGLFLAACSQGAPSEEDSYSGELRAVRSSYRTYFQSYRPDYVVITYPESVLALSVHNRKVFQIITDCLKDQDIPHQCLRLDDALETLTSPRLAREYLAYRIPPTVVRKVAGGTLMYINLEAPEGLRTKRHPLAVEHDIDVRVWFDRSAEQAIL